MRNTQRSHTFYHNVSNLEREAAVEGENVGHLFSVWNVFNNVADKDNGALH